MAAHSPQRRRRRRAVAGDLLPWLLAAALVALAAVGCLAAFASPQSPWPRGAPGAALRGGRGRSARLAEQQTAGPATATGEIVSPFEEGSGAQAGKPTLPLTWENVDAVLDELRPYLRSDGGDCKIVEIDGPIVRLELQGSCSSCSSSAVTLKMGIERTLLERIPEIAEVNAVMPDQEPLTREGVEEVLNGIRPFLSVSGGTIDMQELEEGLNPRLVLEMTGPPLKSTAVKTEVMNRLKRKYPILQDVDIVGSED